MAEKYSVDIIHPPYKNQFWEVGQRSRQLSQWLSKADDLDQNSNERKAILAAVETAATALFPFLKGSPRQTNSKLPPLARLRSSFEKGSRGIVIPVGGGDESVRYASHLVVSLRQIFGCHLPIQIVYAGESDLSKNNRDTISALDGTKDIEFLDVLTIFDDSTLRLEKGGWAIKPFAALASRFEQVILLDADVVFLQTPETLFGQRPYIENGAYLFHDRLLWQHAFRDRHDWWEDQIKKPSPAMSKSLVWTKDYAEECDSGVVVVDKARPEVLVGLLHIAWQNTYDVREEVTYKITYGDKESWWLGFELAGSGYEFEAHYGSMVGWAPTNEDGDAEDQVCSFVIAHLDGDENLIWYNGGLLKNKLAEPQEYAVPKFWMVNGTWEKGATKQEMSCMVGAEVRRLTGEQQSILRRSIEVATRVDEVLGLG
ncbi:hypothetical protein P152DRAFT_484189 [Eremomyces bilateralis CBS 781.70]|uniref:Glycosyltransferase family 71 protein n=1 Tax=Eremomyces bilateralis CBS 781.70 TaxID=1392243 RepID=A0A6G1FWR5_9PEZI|nr:uncharacterized protein P152DRAFT_484189 [Eremomyces bilateralis CBS 781.70]KAF1810126.1 hypothetical protein P152DRAFT_484189 [Eremomyces bilateralis CBS 781.70]